MITKTSLRAVVICSPTALSISGESIRRHLKTQFCKNNVIFITTDKGSSLNLFLEEILKKDSMANLVIGIDAPQGTMAFLHEKAHEKLNGETMPFVFVAKKIQQKATPLPIGVRVVPSVEDIPLPA